MENFKKFFLGSYKTKMEASIWAMVLPVLVGFFGWICGENAVRFIVIIEILLPSFLLSFSFKQLYKTEKIEKVFTVKSFLWIVCNMAIIIILAIIWGWFYKTWCLVAFTALMIIGMYVLVLGEKWIRE